MIDPLFLTVEQVLRLHREQVEEFKSPPGIRDPGLLESAVLSPQHVYEYDEDSDIFDLAATYAYKIAKNHPFDDGNKRSALAASVAFLMVNGLTLSLPENLLTDAMLNLVTDKISMNDFSEILSWGCTLKWVTEDLEADVGMSAEQVRDCLARMPAAVREEMAQYERNGIQFEALPAHVQDHIIANAVDHATSHFRIALITKCERYCVKPSRIQEFLNRAEASAYALVSAQLRREFGMG